MGTTNSPNSTSAKATPPKPEETDWTDEGGSNQHYRHTDEQPGEPGFQPFGPDEDRSWKKFEPTYGKRFESSVKPIDEKVPGGRK